LHNNHSMPLSISHFVKLDCITCAAACLHAKHTILYYEHTPVHPQQHTTRIVPAGCSATLSEARAPKHCFTYCTLAGGS
jgi:hypothetical protein